MCYIYNALPLTSLDVLVQACWHTLKPHDCMILFPYFYAVSDNNLTLASLFTAQRRIPFFGMGFIVSFQVPRDELLHIHRTVRQSMVDGQTLRVR